MRQFLFARTLIIVGLAGAFAMAQPAMGGATPRPGEVVRHLMLQSRLLTEQAEIDDLRRAGVANDSISISEALLVADSGNPWRFIKATDEEVRAARVRFQRSAGHGVPQSFTGIILLDVESPKIGTIASQLRNWDRSEESVNEIAEAFARRVRIWSENRPELGEEYVGFPNAQFCFWGAPSPNGIRTKEYAKNLAALRVISGVDPIRKASKKKKKNQRSTRRGRKGTYVRTSALEGCAFVTPLAYPAYGFDDLDITAFKDPDAPTCELNRSRKVARQKRDLLDDRVRWGVVDALRLLDSPFAPPALADIDMLVMLTFRVSNGFPNTNNPLQCLQSFDPTLAGSLALQVNEARRLRTGTAWQPGDHACGEQGTQGFREPDLGPAINANEREIHYGFWVQDYDIPNCVPCNRSRTSGYRVVDTVPESLMNLFVFGDFDDDGEVTSSDAAYLNENYGDDPWFDVDQDGNWTDDWSDDFGALTQIMFGNAPRFRNSAFGPQVCTSN